VGYTQGAEDGGAQTATQGPRKGEAKMKDQTPIVKKGTKMEASGHSVIVVGIRRGGIECILEDGRLVTVSFRDVEQGMKTK